MADIVDIVTYCPDCNTLHIDEGEWRDRPHKTHLCAKCKKLWRPDDLNYTRGVAPKACAYGGAGDD